ncbi:hypothetical protein [Atlantibacter sp.]|uniref:hypothetical protein n=1 Tax=Atlantibacter sp. TaxID=1903473 RepID=UPI0013EF87D8|nr:hypothetical protein [Atlantibacter sp.]
MNEFSQERLTALADGCTVSREEVACLARELILARQQIARFQQQLAAQILLPVCSASPVCEIEAGYAAGVNDCKEAIRRAGYPIEGDD